MALSLKKQKHWKPHKCRIVQNLLQWMHCGGKISNTYCWVKKKKKQVAGQYVECDRKLCQKDLYPKGNSSYYGCSGGWGVKLGEGSRPRGTLGLIILSFLVRNMCYILLLQLKNSLEKKKIILLSSK